MKIIRLEDVTKETVLREWTPEELPEVYRLAREAFTAADLQKFTEPLDNLVDAEEVLREIEENQARFDAEKKQP